MDPPSSSLTHVPFELVPRLLSFSSGLTRGQLGGGRGGDGRTDGHVAPKLLQPRPQGVFVFQYGELN